MRTTSMTEFKEYKHDRECIHCEKFFDCLGKLKSGDCINFEERKKVDTRSRFQKLYDTKEGDNDGRKKNVHKEDNR